uniref:Glutaredoxin domain-containing protein n=1 Tax=Strongyloides venezuelensis TaxID=75913 RepID=A0A0K0FHL9_STRVS
MTVPKEDTIEVIDTLCKYKVDKVPQMFLVKVDNDYLIENNFNNILLMDSFPQNSTNINPKDDTVFN